MTLSHLAQRVRSIPLGTALTTAALAAGALTTIAPISMAQWDRQSPDRGRALFEWSGSVDREKQITMRGARIWTNDMGWGEPRAERARAISSLPRQDGWVVVRMIDGRGSVQVLQQPTARNNYSTVLRIIDPRGGADSYRLAAYWQGYDARNDGVYGRTGGIYDDDQTGGRGIYSRERDDNGRGRGRGRGRGAGGQDGSRAVLHWTGNVDDDLEIRMQNGQIRYRTLRGAPATGIRVTSNAAAITRSDAQLAVVQTRGRGSVAVTQQPSAWNGYTTVLRVRDPQGGYGYYNFDIVSR